MRRAVVVIPLPLAIVLWFVYAAIVVTWWSFIVSVVILAAVLFLAYRLIRWAVSRHADET